MRIALDSIQARHPLLRVCIVRIRWAGTRFESGGVAEIPLGIVRAPKECWVDEAESELHTMLPMDQGLLMRSVLIRAAELAE